MDPLRDAKDSVNGAAIGVAAAGALSKAPSLAIAGTMYLSIFTFPYFAGELGEDSIGFGIFAFAAFYFASYFFVSRAFSPIANQYSGVFLFTSFVSGHYIGNGLQHLIDMDNEGVLFAFAVCMYFGPYVLLMLAKSILERTESGKAKLKKGMDMYLKLILGFLFLTYWLQVEFWAPDFIYDIFDIVIETQDANFMFGNH